jgi:hypothetical protein
MFIVDTPVVQRLDGDKWVYVIGVCMIRRTHDTSGGLLRGRFWLVGILDY